MDEQRWRETYPSFQKVTCQRLSGDVTPFLQVAPPQKKISSVRSIYVVTGRREIGKG